MSAFEERFVLQLSSAAARFISETVRVPQIDTNMATIPFRAVFSHCLLHRHVQRFRGGLVLKAHRLCVSLNSRLESNKEERISPRPNGGRAELFWTVPLNGGVFLVGMNILRRVHMYQVPLERHPVQHSGAGAGLQEGGGAHGLVTCCLSPLRTGS